MAGSPIPSIGILGGSFDPIHLGHCALAQAALEYFNLEKIFFIPAGTPPHKSKTVKVTGYHRLAMLRLAIAGNRFFSALDIEIRRTGYSYTVDTLAELKKKYPDKEIFFIIGSDNLREIPTWHRYKAILPMITLCVARRPGYPVRIPGQIRGTRLRTFPLPDWALSSSTIRDYLKNGLSCRYLVASPVLAYIKKHSLYH
jgi:nicotinate-nucleotide adenylyltransferase